LALELLIYLGEPRKESVEIERGMRVAEVLRRASVDLAEVGMVIWEGKVLSLEDEAPEFGSLRVIPQLGGG